MRRLTKQYQRAKAPNLIEMISRNNEAKIEVLGVVEHTSAPLLTRLSPSLPILSSLEQSDLGTGVKHVAIAVSCRKS